MSLSPLLPLQPQHRISTKARLLWPPTGLLASALVSLQCFSCSIQGSPCACKPYPSVPNAQRLLVFRPEFQPITALEAVCSTTVTLPASFSSLSAPLFTVQQLGLLSALLILHADFGSSSGVITQTFPEHTSGVISIPNTSLVPSRLSSRSNFSHLFAYSVISVFCLGTPSDLRPLSVLLRGIFPSVVPASQNVSVDMCCVSDCRKSTHTACRPHCPVVPKALFTDFLHFTPSLPLPPPVTWDHLPSKLVPLGEKDTHVHIYVYSICHIRVYVYIYVCTVYAI